MHLGVAPFMETPIYIWLSLLVLLSLLQMLHHCKPSSEHQPDNLLVVGTRLIDGRGVLSHFLVFCVFGWGWGGVGVINVRLLLH